MRMSVMTFVANVGQCASEFAQLAYVFTYDADGNMTGDGRFTYTWNDENRMVSASNAEVVATYAYDHKGRMIRKTVSRHDSEPQSMEYVWDGWNIIRETRVTGLASHVSGLVSNVTYNLWGLDIDGTMQGAGGVGGLLAVIRDGETYIPTYDANGNISEYIDSSDGTIAAHYDYSPFGETLVASGPQAASFTHRFSTKPYCSVTGFCEYQMRKYNPNLGRWMSRDPKGESRGFLLYGFTKNRALSLFDVLGFDIWTENTTAVHGWHRRVCVDEWVAMSAPVVNAGICCVDGTIYIKTGKKYCISFGMIDSENGNSLDSWSGDGGSFDSDSSGEDSSSSEDETSFNTGVIVDFPPGFDGPNPSGDGVVYVDNISQKTKEIERLSGTCCTLDMNFMSYMKSLVSQKANYSIIGQSCRSFSNAMFDHAKKLHGELCK